MGLVVWCVNTQQYVNMFCQYVLSNIASVKIYLPFLSVTSSRGLKGIIMWVELLLAQILPSHLFSHHLIVCVEEHVSWRNITSEFCR